jgi:hypothetical protein
MGILLNTPDQIEQYRLHVLYQALKLETLGLKHSRGSVYALIKKQFGLQGNKASVLKQFGQLIGKDTK